MKEVTFSVPVNGTLKINDGSITIVINPAVITIPMEIGVADRMSGDTGGKKLHDIILETAIHLVGKKRTNEFTAAELFHHAQQTYQSLNKSSFSANVIAAAPNHSSYKHYSSQRDHFEFLGDGKYKLKEDFVVKPPKDE